MINAVIFDVDGLLIDTEPLWNRASAEGFQKAGIDCPMTYIKSTQGMRIDQGVAGWYEREPWSHISVPEVTQLIVDRVIELIQTEGEAMPGALQTVEFFKERSLPIGVASSSHCTVIEANIAALGLEGCFDTIASAEDEVYGKPHPAVYLSAAGQLGVNPRHCLVFEDSIYGVVAAKASEMTCVCVPDQLNAADKRLGIADYVLPSLNEFDEALWREIRDS